MPADIADIQKQFEMHGGSTPEFSLKGKRTCARVVSIYDGDTCKCVIPLFNSFFKFDIRLNGIDTCEIKSKSQLNKTLALMARNKLFTLVSGSSTLSSHIDINKYLESNVCVVRLLCYDFDKYGRLLADMYDLNDENLSKSFSDYLIEAKLAYEYSGDTKLSEDKQLTRLTPVPGIEPGIAD